ncbi:MAG: Crp/Fnr family transcriptional regulator [Alphaproteobacteria bacterium]|nr:Crp/Fnr family transcriptional regulator [Alphaproteobacteria bacterium]
MPEGKDKRGLLADLDLFRKLRADELDRLVAFTRWTQPKARTVLFRKSDPGTSMMVLSKGRVKVCTHSEDGKELVLNMFGPGDVFGEIALLDGSPRTADAVTIDDCELLVLDRRDFIPFLLEHSDASVRMLEVLTLRLRHTTQLLEDVAFREGPSRLARRLVDLAEFSGRQVENGVFVDMALSQQQLGNMVGMTRESINKQLRLWRNEGLICWTRGYYTITNLEQLSKI